MILVHDHEQVFMYVAGAQLLFSSPRSSIPASLCGALAGVAYHSNFLSLKRLQVCSVVCRASNGQQQRCNLELVIACKA